MLLKEEVVHSLLLEQIPRQFVHNVHLVVLVLDLAQFLQCDFVLMQNVEKGSFVDDHLLVLSHHFDRLHDRFEIFVANGLDDG